MSSFLIGLVHVKGEEKIGGPVLSWNDAKLIRGEWGMHVDASTTKSTGETTHYY
jgi:hypothetical protein